MVDGSTTHFIKLNFIANGKSPLNTFMVEQFFFGLTLFKFLFIYVKLVSSIHLEVSLFKTLIFSFHGHMQLVLRVPTVREVFFFSWVDTSLLYKLDLSRLTLQKKILFSYIFMTNFLQHKAVIIQ